MATAPNSYKKDTVYIDVDDEITTIIDKLQSSSEKIVALVLPKRATVLQSVVNMKLLKRSAENAKKHIVLITSEAGLLPLAGSVGLHVASSLQSKPAIPLAPAGPAREQAIDEDSGEAIDDFDPEAVAAEPVGKLAGPSAAVGTVAAAGIAASAFNEPETIELDNDEADTATASAGAEAALATSSAATTTAVKGPKKGKNKKLKVPNFNRFRMVLFAGLALLILLIGGFIYANIALAKATITVKTNSSDIATKTTLTLDPTATEVDLTSSTLPAKVETKQQSGSQQVSTSGQKNNGTKATGTVTMSSQVCGALNTINSPDNVPAGTGVSSGNKTFITQQLTTFPDSGTYKSGCVTYQATGSTDVTAQAAGADYNIDAGTFTVAGRTDLTAKSNDAFTGGTDNIVKVVAQADIDSAKAKITSSDSSGSGPAKDSLTTKLQTDGYNPIPSSLNAGDPVITPSAAVGDQADTVTVTVATTYSMYGVKLADVKNIVVSNVNKQIDKSKQQILNDGVSSATYKVTTPVASGPVQVALSATSLAGPDIKPDTLKTQLAGKKTGDVTETIKAIPGVDDVSVKYSPFWVSSVPKNASKIDIVIEKSNQ